MSTGNFTWFDLMTTDVASARAFYTALFGWETREFDFAPGYPIIHVAGIGIGGIAQKPAGDPSPSHWLSVLTTDDLDGTLARLQELGGRVYAPPMAIPNVGRYAVVADPQGAAFCLLQHENEQPKPTFPKGAANIGWAELQTTDSKGALAFYTTLLGWPVQNWEMPGAGTYYLVGHAHNAGIMDMPPGTPPELPPHWLVYVDVQNTDATATKVKELGGAVLHGPDDIPGVGRFAVFADPTGAVFAVMQSAPRE
ncbi:MAG: VOC family protein [Myxococcota bacterium]